MLWLRHGFLLGTSKNLPAGLQTGHFLRFGAHELKFAPLRCSKKPGFRLSRKVFRSTLLLVISLGGCSTGNYAGDVVPAQPGRCGRSSRGVLTIENKHFVFVPDEGVLTIAGLVESDGALHGVSSVPSAAVPHKMPPSVFAGQLRPSGIEGELDRAGCRFSVLLQRSQGSE